MQIAFQSTVAEFQRKSKPKKIELAGVMLKTLIELFPSPTNEAVERPAPIKTTPAVQPEVPPLVTVAPILVKNVSVSVKTSSIQEPLGKGKEDFRRILSMPVIP